MGSFLALSTNESIVVAQPAEVSVSPPAVSLEDFWLLDTDPLRDSLFVLVEVLVSRNQPEGEPRDIPFRFEVRMVGDGLLAGSDIFEVDVSVPAVIDDMPVQVGLTVKPEMILSEEADYILRVAVSHVDDPPDGEFETDHLVDEGPFSFVHFSGALSFGDVQTTVLSFSEPPAALPGPGAWQVAVAEGELSNGIGFSNGPPPSTSHLEVQRNDSDGSATVVDGAVVLDPDDRSFSVNGWTGEVGRVSLDADGFETATFTLDLPEGTGWRTDTDHPDFPQTLNPTFVSAGGTLAVDEDLQPLAGSAGTFSMLREFVDERLAVGFVGLSWEWDLEILTLAQPETRFFRQWHYDQWMTVKGDLPDSNDGYLDQLAQDAVNHLQITPGMGGGFTVELAIEAGEFATHFPHGYMIHSGGVLRVVNSTPDPDESVFEDAMIAVFTHTGCRESHDPHGVPDPATLEAVAVGPVDVRFTAQGSLWTEGEPLASYPGADIPIVRRAAAGLDPGSGLPVHETANYVGRNVQMLFPSPTVPAEEGLPGGLNPARWLYTGLRPDEDDALEYPGTTAYLAGEGDYPGVNFRHFPGLTGISRIGGGEMGPYDLGICQKVYARASGTTGRWAAEESSLPPSIQVGGPDPFTFQFDVWAFQLVGNEPHFEYSAVTGSVSLPYPADFTLAFDSIEFRCCGNLDRMSLADGESIQTLAYWNNSRIAIQSARFVSADECSMDDSCLELHVRARVNGLPDDLDGILLFRGSGRMTTGLDDPHPASALHVNSGSTFMGDYYIEPARHIYYNDPGPVAPAEPVGMLSLAGHLSLPFFVAMEAHAVLTGTEDVFNPDIIPGLQRGWTDNGGNTYFSNANFDAAHTGFPSEFNTAQDYAVGDDEDYLPRASRTWFGLVPFDFPVRFDPFTRHFHSLEKEGFNVIIAEAEAEVPRLNHEQAAIDFGITIGLSLNNLFSDVLEFATGKLVEGFADLVIGTALEQVNEGLTELDALLSLQARDALGETVIPEFDDLIAQAAQQIKGGAGVDTALDQIDFGAVLQEDVASATAGFVTGRLGPISNGLGGMRSFFEEGNENEMGQFMKAAMGFFDLPVGLASLSIEELLELAELADPALRDRLEELRDRMQELSDFVDNVTGLGSELEGLLTGANAEFMSLQTNVRDALKDYFEMVDLDPGAFTQAEIETRIRNELEDRLWAMPVTGQVQNVLRFRFHHTDHLIKQVLSGALEQINGVIVDLIAEAIDLDEIFNDLTGFGAYMQAVSLKGEAVITGNDLTYLSLKGSTSIQTEPIPLDFEPFYEYQQLHSDGATGCNPNAEPALFNRITMGATVSPARSFGMDVSVTVSTQFSFTEDGGIIGFMGGFEVLQEGLAMQPVNFDRINALLNIGGNEVGAFEFYMAAEGEATVFATSELGPQLPWSNFKLHGGVFAGRTCSDAPYAAWAPAHVTEGIAGFPFTGGIVAVNGKFPFIDAGCVLRLKAGASIGAWGGFQQGTEFTAAAFVDGSVSGRFACVVSGEGSVLLIGSADKSGASMEGSIKANITAGKCPICLKLDAGIGVKLGTPGGLSVDL